MGPIIHFLWHIRSHVSVLDFSEGKWKGFTRALPELWTDWLLLTYLLPGFIPPASYTIVSQKLSPYFDNFQPVFHSMQRNSMNGSLDTDMSLDYSLKMTIPLQEQTLSYCSSSKCKELFWNSHEMWLPARHTHHNSDCWSEKMAHTVSKDICCVQLLL